MGRLRQALGGARTLTRATAFTTRQDQAPASGFDLAVATDDFAGGMRLAAAAFALAQLHGAIVLAPATPSLRQLAAALQLAGHRVEFASLAPAGDGGTRQLGRECLFVP